MSAADIKVNFKGFDTSLLPVAGPWFTSANSATGGATSTDEDQTRAVRVSRWLHSAELHADIGGDVMVMFMHGDIINLLIQSLMNMQPWSHGGTPPVFVRALFSILRGPSCCRHALRRCE
jgi:hypothetical protein